MSRVRKTELVLFIGRVEGGGQRQGLSVKSRAKWVEFSLVPGEWLPPLRNKEREFLQGL